MLYNKHLGLQGRFDKLLAAGDEKARFVKEAVDAVKAECRAGAMQAGAIYRFYEAEPDGNRILLYEAGADQPAGAFDFPRQTSGDGLCLADYVAPPGADGRRDTLCLMVTGAGAGIRALAEGYKEEGSYVRSHALAALALETAEAAMEWIHAQVRGLWGFPDDPGRSLEHLFKTRYRGRRYSFGYPACPDLEQQTTLFALLRPEEIGISLTDGFMMEPEASVSAIAFHHPQAAYFAVKVAS
jgi:5-methyltetrahydrofolate--homocysteine methyltransferase